MRLGLYVDFDNLYNGLLDKLGIKAKHTQPISKLKIDTLKNLIEITFGIKDKNTKELEDISKLEYVPYEDELSEHESDEDRLNILNIINQLYSVINVINSRPDIDIAYTKMFAEFEKLPFSQDFFNYYKLSMQSFIHSLNAKPINPFVNYSKSGKKFKNASDISLTLEVITDLIIKKSACGRSYNNIRRYRFLPSNFLAKRTHAKGCIPFITKRKIERKLQKDDTH